MTISLTDKQKEYIRESNGHRWSIKSGAVRSGKSFVDTMFVIPKRIRDRRGLSGLCCIIGVSKATIERNVLEPMREFFGKERIGTINNNNQAILFGEEVYCLGAEKASQVSKIQGASIKYCYGDEIARWNKDVFEILKSRLDKPYSCFDGSCNPESPNHWLKEFIDDDSIDLYLQRYTIFDNPNLPSTFVENLCKEYAGTVFYDRYILGQWKKAEGLVYQKFANKPEDYIVHEIPKMMKINIGVDFGGNGSWHTFVATGFGYGYQFVIHLESEKIEGAITPDELEKSFVSFIKKIIDKYRTYLPVGNCFFNVYCDSAEQVLIRGLKTAAIRNNLPINIKNALKMEIKQRIALQTRMLGLKMLLFYFSNANCINAYSKAEYSDKEGHQDERLDDSVTNKDGTIDTLDAAEYSMEGEYKNIINALEGMRV